MPNISVIPRYMARGNPSPRQEFLEPYKFRTDGKYHNLSRTPISIKLPVEIEDLIRSLPNKNQWIIEAIYDKLDKDTSN